MYDVEHQILMIGTDMVAETSAIFNQLTRLIAREDFITFSRIESCRSKISEQVQGRITISFSTNILHHRFGLQRRYPTQYGGTRET
jgi:hypothetical protein